MINPKDYGITEKEYAVIQKDLQRDPNHVEMGIYSAMWSEHCSYKHTKPLLKQLPTRSSFVVQGPGENAGVVAIDQDWNLVFKIESHNHPSYVAPYDGAATGVGGLLRDIMAMGARPVGVKALLRFGDIDQPNICRLVSEVRRGAAYYAAGCDVASLGEELFLHSSFATNPLVNVIVLGLARSTAIMQSSAGGVGNQFIYFGRPTGTDGVNGASFASQGIDENTKAHPPAGEAAIGNDLMIATLKLIEAGLVEGLQDMGAAGLTSSSFEMAHKAGCGFTMNLDSLPKTSERISGYELLLSETQERMLAAVRPEHVNSVMKMLAEFPSLSASVIGEITADKQAVISYCGEVIANMPVQSVADGFVLYSILGETTRPTDSSPVEPLKQEVNSVCRVRVETNKENSSLKASQLSPLPAQQTEGLCSAIELPEINKKILLRTLSNGAEIVEDPYHSVYQVVAQAHKDLKSLGAQPIALSDCLNCGDPDNPQTANQIIEGIRGMADACRDLEIPVIGGNVSLYNATNDKSILSQFIIGMVGIMDLEN